MSDDELEVVDPERRRALARLGLAFLIAYAAPVLLQLRAAAADDDDDDDGGPAPKGRGW